MADGKALRRNHTVEKTRGCPSDVLLSQHRPGGVEQFIALQTYRKAQNSAFRVQNQPVLERGLGRLQEFGLNCGFRI